MARYGVTLRRLAWPNMLLIGGGIGVLVVSFLLVLSVIRSYVEPPKIQAARPMLASADSTIVEMTGFAGPMLSPLEIARATAMESLAAAMAQGAAPAPLAADDPPPAQVTVPLPPQRPRAGPLIQVSSAVPVPRPRPRD